MIVVISEVHFYGITIIAKKNYISIISRILLIRWTIFGADSSSAGIP